jgi:hypothetical protein
MPSAQSLAASRACASRAWTCLQKPSGGQFREPDLTLLSIDEQNLPIYLQMRRMPLWEKNPWPGEPVIVAIPEGTARSHIISPLTLPFSSDRLDAAGRAASHRVRSPDHNRASRWLPWGDELDVAVLTKF